MFGVVVFLTYLIYVQNADSSPRSDGSQSDLVGDKANRMCKTYAKYGLEKETNSCAFKKDNLNSSDAIVGIASRKEFPHMVHLNSGEGEDSSWACGGTLISDRFILTTAHCTIKPEFMPKLVRAGITNVNDRNNLQIRNVTRIMVHPDYNPRTFYNDIALLEVDSPFEINSYVRPACIHTEKNIPSKNGITTGWGTNFEGNDNEDLKKNKLEILESSKCEKTYRRDIDRPGSRLPNGFSNDLLICAGSENLITCEGNTSGGPLQIYHEDTDDIKCMYSIVGIISFGKGCRLVENIPDGFTRVFPYLKWIEDNVWP